VRTSGEVPERPIGPVSKSSRLYPSLRSLFYKHVTFQTFTSMRPLSILSSESPRKGFIGLKEVRKGVRFFSTYVEWTRSWTSDPRLPWPYPFPLFPMGRSAPPPPHSPATAAATFDFQGGQPSPAVAKRVDALEVAQVQNLPVLLRRVADDGDLAGAVPLGDRRQGGPAQAGPLLVVQGQVGVVVGVDTPRLSGPWSM
jgi:hypothetical protein